MNEWESGGTNTPMDLLRRIEGKLDKFSALLKIESDRVTDHEKRIRRVEQWMYSNPVALVSSVIALYLTVRGQ